MLPKFFTFMNLDNDVEQQYFHTMIFYEEISKKSIVEDYDAEAAYRRLIESEKRQKRKEEQRAKAQARLSQAINMTPSRGERRNSNRNSNRLSDSQDDEFLTFEKKSADIFTREKEHLQRIRVNSFHKRNRPNMNQFNMNPNEMPNPLDVIQEQDENVYLRHGHNMSLASDQ